MSNNASSPTPDASATVKGKNKLANDFGGTADSPTVVATHLSSALPVNQGGTGVTTSTGSTNVVLSGSPTIVTPTIASFTNATHDHSNAAGGGVLTHTAFPSGAVVQVVSTLASAVATGTTAIPNDDTIPQITEGDEYMTLAITPKSTTNLLVIQVKAFLSSSIATRLIAALFQDSTANALAADMLFETTATAPNVVALTHTMTAGTTSSTTFRVRCGSQSAGTTTFNGESGARKFGAIPKSSIVIWEIKA